MTLRASEDKLWDVLVHPHKVDDNQRGLGGNNPRWKIPSKARNEHTEAMIKDHHFLKGGFSEFYKSPAEPSPAAAASASSAAGGGEGSSLPSVNKKPAMHPGGDRKHFEQKRCEEKSWHPSFKRATIDIFPPRPTGKRALTPPNQEDRTEVDDIPRGKKRTGNGHRDQFADLPMFTNSKGVRSVIDPKTGQRISDARCEESMEQVALRRGMKKYQSPPKEEKKIDSVRVKSEVEFRTEYAARMKAGQVNRDASNRNQREANAAQVNLDRYRTEIRRGQQDRSRAYDVACVRNLPSFVNDGDD